MTSAAEMHERHARMLARYAELAMTLAEQMHHDAITAETPAERAAIASSFHRICRCGRQSMALEARLLRDARHEARAEAAIVREARDQRVAARKKSLGQAVQRLIWTEVEDEEQVEALQDLEACLAEEALCEDFLDQPVEDQLARLRLALGLTDPPPREEMSAKPTEEGPAAESHPPARPRAGGDPGRVPTSDPAGHPSAPWVPVCAGTRAEEAGVDLAFDAAPPAESS